MFCSNCGEKATGNFCSICGGKLHAAKSSEDNNITAGPNCTLWSTPAVDWSNEINYDSLIHIKEVKDHLAMQIPKGRKMTAEEFLSIFPEPAKLGGKIGQSLANAMGVKVKRAQVKTASSPCGKVLVSFLVYIAGLRMSITNVQQASDAVVFICDIPSDFKSEKGELIVKVSRVELATVIEATATIPGQMYDWGKTEKILKKLFAAIESGQDPSNLLAEAPSLPARASLAPNQAIAKFDFAAERPSDLGFKKGDVITILSKTDRGTDWWVGKIGDRSGNFPSNYVSLN